MKKRTDFHRDFRVRSFHDHPDSSVYLSLNAEAVDVSEDDTAFSLALTEDETLDLISELKHAIGLEE